MRNLKQNMQLKSAKHSKTQVSITYGSYSNFAKPLISKIQQTIHSKTTKA